MQQGETTRVPQSSISAALAASNAIAHPETPALPANAGHTIAEMAQLDLDAALQLLADRAQYITGANGAAIALRRDGKKDMLCRASTGSNVPGLGALLSTEFGLSGESVRTRQPMRCDDAARDARVNHDVCREMGIASVVVMPVVQDDQVLGVFELFSGQVNAFGERDVSALQRLSGLVETAVRLARASVQVSAGMKEDVAPPYVQNPAVETGPTGLQSHGEMADFALEVEPQAPGSGRQVPAVESVPQPRDGGISPFASFSEQAQIAEHIPPTQEGVVASAGLSLPITERKPLFWSAALDASANAHAGEDRSQVPPMLRNLRKCQACGFPVSSDRTLCVECEEKKWRGQLRGPKPVAPSALPEQSTSAASGAAAPAKAVHVPRQLQTVSSSSTPGTAQVKSPEKAVLTLSNLIATQRVPSESAAERISPDGAPLLTGGLAASESWFSANKYILGAVLVVAVIVGTILLLH